MLQIGPRRLYEVTRILVPGYARLEMENSVLLQDVFDPAAKLYELVAPIGKVYPLTDVYRLWGTVICFFILIPFVLR